MGLMNDYFDNKKADSIRQDNSLLDIPNHDKGNIDMATLAHTPVQINDQAIQIIAYQGLPIVTTEMLAGFYGTEANNIKVNHSRNADRFIEGKHYFKVQGEDLKELRLQVTSSNSQISPKTRSLILWTERGAARHAKMLDTEQAWDVFEKLEDFYFKKETQPVVTLATLPKIPKNPHLMLRKAVLKVAATREVSYQTVYSRLYDRFQVESYKDIPPEYCLAAVEYVKALEGEYLPKLEPSKVSLDSKTLANIQALMVNYELMRKFTESTLSQNFIMRNIWEALRLISPNDAAYYNRYIADTNQLARKVSIALDFRNRQNQPLISPDGSVIHFQSGVMFAGINPKWFSMKN